MPPPTALEAPGPAVGSGTPTAPRRRRGRPRDPEVDGRILAAASTLILTRGFDTMTIDDVAREAGVGKATVYRRWPHKEDLAVAAMQRLTREEEAIPDTGSIRGDLTAWYADVVGFASTDAGRDYIRTRVTESMRDDRIADLIRTGTLRAQKNAAVMIERAIERGEVRPDADLEVAGQLLSAVVTQRAVAGLPMPTEDDVPGLVDFVLRGIGA